MKKTLFTIDRGIMEGDGPTYKAIAEVLGRYSDLKVIDGEPENYNFKDNKVRTMKYVKGKFQDLGFETPEADFWVFYSFKSSKTDISKAGYTDYKEYRSDLLSFLEKQVISGNVGKVINSPETERKVRKSFLAELNSKEYGVIPSYVFKNFDELYEKFKEKGELVIKPDFGGDMKGVELVKDYDHLFRYKNLDFSNFSFQDNYPGIEKRFFIVGGKVAEGRTIINRNNPWIKHKVDSVVSFYNEKVLKGDAKKLREYYNDLNYVNKILKRTGLILGSVDFLGDKINEINGGGTGFVNENRSGTFYLDATPQLKDYLKSLLK